MLVMRWQDTMEWEVDPLRIVQEIEICPYYQIVCAQTRIHSGEWDVQNSLGFSDTNRLPNLGQKTRSINKKKKTNFPVNGFWRSGVQLSEDKRKQKR